MPKNILNGHKTRILLTIEGGEVTSERVLHRDELVSSLDTFIEIVAQAGFDITPPPSPLEIKGKKEAANDESFL